jgi:hypothetical protein
MENQSAASRYAKLSSDRTIFLDTARDCAALSVPYLLTPTGVVNGQKLPTPWQSMGAKGVNVMASKLMLSLFPVNATFFKLQINDGKLSLDPSLSAAVKSEIDLSLSKMERVVMQNIAESQDRVILHQAMKHLIVTGNALVYMGSRGVKLYPLDRYVVVRDGEGNPTEVVTVESIDRQFLPEEFQTEQARNVNDVADNTSAPSVDVTVGENEAAVYTWAKLKDGQWRWRQEAEGKILPDSLGKAPKNTTPWLPLRFNVVDGEDYGRGRIEEYLGDLKSLEGLMQAMVEGSAAAAKVVFLVSPAATVKPSTLAKAGNGAIIQGRAEDVTAVQVSKQADFSSAYQMIQSLTQRLSEAFLILTVRQSERTTAEEIRATQQELNEQLGGIYGNLTVELVRPYLQRKLFTLQRSKELPQLPKGIVYPTIIAGLEGIGRGQDRESLMMFLQTISQALGPEAMAQYIDPEEAVKRLAAAQGIDTLKLVKTADMRQQEQQKAAQLNMTTSLVGQAGQLAKAPMMDPTKNPDSIEALQNVVNSTAQATGQGQPQDPPLNSNEDGPAPVKLTPKEQFKYGDVKVTSPGVGRVSIAIH